MFQSTRLREARRNLQICVVLFSSFNPRAYVRRDWAFAVLFYSVGGFNPRAYVRRDKTITITVLSNFGFNPRAYVRRDDRPSKF